MNPSNPQLTRDAQPTSRVKKPGGVRWWIVWTLFFSTATNYISRQTFSVLSPMITAQYHLSHTLIRAGQDTPRNSPERGLRRYFDLARSRNVWGIVLGRALTDPIWWFYVFWLPQYLSDARGFSLKRIALFAWMPFVAADIGNFTGGFISGYCIRRGVPVCARAFGSAPSVACRSLPGSPPRGCTARPWRSH